MLNPCRTLVESDPTAEYIVTLLSTTDLPNRPSLKARGLAWRLFSASEVLLGAAIVIGHNVFGVVPNEVPILFVLGLVSVRVRDGGWSALGFRRPESWLRLILIALAAAVLRIVLGASLPSSSGQSRGNFHYDNRGRGAASEC